jgi:nucleoside-diphosphate-sugar epimerase
VNIGNPEEFTLLELAEAVKEVTGCPPAMSPTAGCSKTFPLAMRHELTPPAHAGDLT